MAEATNKHPEIGSRAEALGRFDSYAPTEAALDSITDTRTQYRELADFLWHELPAGREKSVALTKLEESMNWANKGISRHNQDPEKGAAK